ncbi:MAG: polyprenyl synthetase family protein [Desulfobacteraceae bacterium]|nr:polyprenyl synthetase family protein [Desulfobacteraceae bacterium]
MSELKKKILHAVNNDLEAIEVALVENLTPHVDLVREVAGHILFSGGKRLRPLLMVIAARLCDYRGDYDKTFSTIFEYLHAATLLHDDLVDGATTRRGRGVANTVYGSSAAVLTGDFLLARGLSIAAATGIPEVISVIAGITEDMSQGEIFQLARKGAPDLTELEYMKIIRCKTAVLFQGACRISALLAEAAPEKQEALSGYGHHLGMAFQMADDLLDYTLDSRKLGKTVGADLREGKLTLPVIHALRHANTTDRKAILESIENPDLTDPAFKNVIRILTESGGIEYTRENAQRHVGSAKDSLEPFPDSENKRILLDLADYALTRST